MPTDNRDEFPSQIPMTGVNTAGVVQSLTPDPLGRYVFHVRDDQLGLLYRVRANKRKDLWDKVRRHQEDGAYVNTGACAVVEVTAARPDDPDFEVGTP